MLASLSLVLFLNVLHICFMLAKLASGLYFEIFEIVFTLHHCFEYSLKRFGTHFSLMISHWVCGQINNDVVVAVAKSLIFFYFRLIISIFTIDRIVCNITLLQNLCNDWIKETTNRFKIGGLRIEDFLLRRDVNRKNLEWIFFFFLLRRVRL